MPPNHCKQRTTLPLIPLPSPPLIQSTQRYITQQQHLDPPRSRGSIDSLERRMEKKNLTFDEKSGDGFGVSKPRETIDRRSGFRWNNRQETFSQRAVNLIALVTSTAAICNSGVCIYIDFIQLPRLTRVAPAVFHPRQKRSGQIFSEKHFPFASHWIDSFDCGRGRPLFLDMPLYNFPFSIFHHPLLLPTKGTRKKQNLFDRRNFIHSPYRNIKNPTSLIINKEVNLVKYWVGN